MEHQDFLLNGSRTIVVPEYLDERAYLGISACFNELADKPVNYEEPIALRICGLGGSYHYALAIVALIKAHGLCIGEGLGLLVSGHSLIWAACHSRYVYPLTTLLIHGADTQRDGVGFNAFSTAHYGKQASHFNWQMASVYADASNKTSQWWLSRLNRQDPSFMVKLDCADIIDMQMGAVYD